MKNPNKKELQEIAINHSSDNNFKDCMKIFIYVLQKHILSFLVNDKTLPSNTPLHFRLNLSERICNNHNNR